MSWPASPERMEKARKRVHAIAEGQSCSSPSSVTDDVRALCLFLCSLEASLHAAHTNAQALDERTAGMTRLG